jgi:dienelactone hydrolase
MWLRFFVAFLAVIAYGEDLPRGQIIDTVRCAGDASQNYALYIPSHYSPDQRWSLILAFDPRARGRAAVEQYKAAAEKYGYIVAGSNVSRNGPPAISLTAAAAMRTDVGKRFSIDPKRIYTAGLSGGARIAMKVAIDSDDIAGVIASSAGFPPGHQRNELRFVVFGTAGTEDFNYIEMRQLDEMLTSPHRVVVFPGGHTWLPVSLAVDAVEWLEIQAMQAGRRKRDAGLIEAIFARRVVELSEQKSEQETLQSLTSLVADFYGLTDVGKYSAQADALRKKKSVRDAMDKERQAERQEWQLTTVIQELEAGLREEPETRAASFSQLKDRLTKLAAEANSSEDSSDRRRARRVLSGVFLDSREVPDSEYRAFVDGLRPPER